MQEGGKEDFRHAVFEISMSVRWRSPHVPYRRPSLGIFFVDRYDSPFGARPEAEVRRVGWSLCAAVASDVRCGRL